MAAEIFAQLSLGGFGVVAQVDIERHQDAGGAEAALQGVMATERLLQHRQTALLRRQAFDRTQSATIGLHGQRQAGARWRTIDLDGARAADTVLAAYMGAGHAEGMAQEIAEQQPRRGVTLDRTAVEREAHAVSLIGAQPRHRRASSIASRP